MPDTDPVVDDALAVRFVRARAAGAAAKVYPIAALTAGRAGERLTEIGELAEAGAVALSDADRSIRNPAILRRAFEYGRMFDLPIIVHCEDPSLSAGGVMHEGSHATRLGLKGIPSIAEETVVARDLMLAEWTGGRIHITQASTAVTAGLIRAAKQRGVNVTADVSPHHLALTDEALSTFDTRLKTNPPLRSKADVDALREGLADGTIDAIASDHTPRSVDEKNTEFQEALSGATGLETMLAVVFTEMVGPGLLTLNDAVRAMSTSPAGILGIEGGSLSSGCTPRAELSPSSSNPGWTQLDRRDPGRLVNPKKARPRWAQYAFPDRPRTERKRNGNHRRRPGKIPARWPRIILTARRQLRRFKRLCYFDFTGIAH